MRATIKDVAKYANVSPATVSLVINNKGSVKAATKERVLEAIEKLEFTPNYMARSLVNRKTYVIGLVVTNINNPFYGEMVMAVQRELEKTNYRLVLGYSGDTVKKERETVEYMTQQGVDGLLIVPSRDGENDLEHLYRLKQLNIPFVFLSNKYTGIRADSVMSDYRISMRDAVKFLLEQGERKIYFFTDNRVTFQSTERIKGFQRAYDEMKVPYQNDWIVEIQPDIDSAIQATDELLQRDRPDAIISLNSMVGLGVTKSLRDHSIRVPEDIALVCYDDMVYLAVLDAPMTTLKQQIGGIAKEAVTLLLDRIDGEQGDYRDVELPVEMIVRASTKKRAK